MWCCFDYFIPEVVPNNVIEQYIVKPNDILVMCCDGMSNWVSENDIFKTVTDLGVEAGIRKLITDAKDTSLNSCNNFDDITALQLNGVNE